ncbi:MAG TPA: hypothetical protein VND40_00235 [Nitrososphaerales archaeon]|nr:hypothetical protein [Nitrososphaerales archaeon]
MHFIDIAVASGYAAVCLSLIVLMNPVAPREAAVEAGAQVALDSAISAYVEHVGLPFLSTSSVAAICGSAADASNATLALDVVVQGQGCGTATPSSPLASSSFTIDLPSRTVVIEAWLVRR